MRTTVLMIATMYSFICHGQSAFVERVVKDGKASLLIGIKNDSTAKYSANCFFKNVTLLPDTTKIRLIGELLNCTSDTTMSYNPVYNLSGHYQTVKKDPISKGYNLQVEALILINYIAFSSNAFVYSPYPLLYDKEAKKEICCDSEELRAVIAVYKNWFDDLKGKGFINYCYPLYNKGYEWFASKTKQQKFNKYPTWNSFYDCKEIE